MTESYVDRHRDFLDSFDDIEMVTIAFQYYPRKDSDQKKYDAVEKCLQRCAMQIMKHLPDRFERLQAMTRLQECGLWCAAGLSRDHATRNLLQKRRLERDLCRSLRGEICDCGNDCK